MFICFKHCPSMSMLGSFPHKCCKQQTLGWEIFRADSNTKLLVFVISIHDHELLPTFCCRMLYSILVLSIKFLARNVAYFSLGLSQDGRTALMLAAVSGRSEMVKLLVHRHKATVDEKDPVRSYKFIAVTKKQIIHVV